MVIELIDLLSERQIVHPSRIVSSTFQGGEVRLSIEGYPWWQSSLSHDQSMILFRFSGLTSGKISLITLLNDGDDEALEQFEISHTSGLDWAQPSRSSIYCSMPLPRPLAVYTAVEDYLLHSRACRPPGDFLNGGDCLSHFLEITASRSYKLATAPPAIHDLIVRELVDQSVRHTIIDGNGRSEGRLFVRLGDAEGFFCESALAEFD